MPSKSSKRALGALRDIRENILLAQRFTENLTYPGFQNDRRTIYAVTRCLEIISEASRRLPPSLKGRHPDIPWEQIAGAGNVYRHDYEDLSALIIWNTVRKALPPLLASIERELALRNDP